MADKARLLILTVGTTALRAEELSTEDDTTLQRDINTYLSDPESTQYWKNESSELFKRVCAAHRLFWDSDLAVGKNAKRTSAEMTSTWLLTMPAESFIEGLFDSKRDCILLLASDTAEGQLCARINAQLMHRYLFRNPCGCDVNFKNRAACLGNNPCVVMEVVDKMEAKKGFRELPEALEPLFRRYIANDRLSYLNITGGYKYAIPTLTWYCMTIYRGIPMFYQHESMDSVVRVEFEVAPSKAPQIKVTRRHFYDAKRR